MENRHTIVFLIITLFLLPSCHPRVITQLQVHRDTTYVTAYLRDSVVRRDSIYIKEYIKGDTIYIVKYRDRWRDRYKEVHDTLIRHQTDTIALQTTIERKVEQPLGFGKKMRLRAFLPLLILALVGWRREIYKLIRRYI